MTMTSPAAGAACARIAGLRRHRASRGMSLVEVMIAMTLGLLLVLGVIQIFAAQRASYGASMAVTQVQETGRFALESLKPVLRASGTLGFCSGELPVTSHLRNDCPAAVGSMFGAGRALTGWEAVGTGASQTFAVTTLVPAGVAANRWKSMQPGGTMLDLPAMLLDQVVPGTDLLVVRTLERVPELTAAGTTNATAGAINLTAGHGLQANEVLLVTNCTDAADLFQNSSAPAASAFQRSVGSCANPGPGNRPPGGHSWSTRYDERMQVYRVRMHAWYVGLDADSGEPGLYRHDISTGTASLRREEIVRGVENMQLRYGLSLPGSMGGDGQSIDHWLSADRVTDWGLVIAAHVSLLVRSDDAVDAGSSQRTLNMAGTLVTHPRDSRLRKRFNATVALRNQVIVL
jgi:type IV pilus assembly protein PilW